MHHGQPIPKNVELRELTAFEYVAAAHAFKEGDAFAFGEPRADLDNVGDDALAQPPDGGGVLGERSVGDCDRVLRLDGDFGIGRVVQFSRNIPVAGVASPGGLVSADHWSRAPLEARLLPRRPIGLANSET